MDADEEFQKLHVLGKPVVVYAEKKTLYRTKCEEIEDIKIYETGQDCSPYLAIEYKTEITENNHGFYTRQNIIRKDPLITVCNNEAKTFRIKNKIIELIENKVIKVSESLPVLPVEFESSPEMNETNGFNIFFHKIESNISIRQAFVITVIITIVIIAIRVTFGRAIYKKLISNLDLIELKPRSEY
jgi:hypothetical protein